MITLKESILKSVKAGKYSKYTLFPRDKYELSKMIKAEIRKNGNRCSLNHIDVSQISSMAYLFSEIGLLKFNGDISKWDVSNVYDMSFMFQNSEFNGDISEWNVSRVENMERMFFGSFFNQDISEWNVSKVENMESMFHISKFNQPIDKWNVSKVKNMCSMFAYSNFNNDISNWKIKDNCKTQYMFSDGDIKEEYKPTKNGERIK